MKASNKKFIWIAAIIIVLIVLFVIAGGTGNLFGKFGFVYWM